VWVWGGGSKVSEMLRWYCFVFRISKITYSRKQGFLEKLIGAVLVQKFPT
jgi:hypothetical protein